jgi:hypothetical protein
MGHYSSSNTSYIVHQADHVGVAPVHGAYGGSAGDRHAYRTLHAGARIE